MSEKNELFETIKAYLLEKSGNIGTRIETETELAQKFNTSRYKIRQVLDSLVQMGLLERAPRRGTVLKTPGTKVLNNRLRLQFDVSGFDIAEFIEARILVECAIIPLAARRITPLMLSKLEHELDQMEKHADEPLTADKHDRDFHLLLLQASGNRVLQVFSDVLITYFEKTSEMLQSCDNKYFLDSVEKQREILNCIKKNDADTAVQLMRDHLLEKSGQI